MRASSSEQHLNCPGFAYLQRNFPLEQEIFKAAEVGNMLHALFEVGILQKLAEFATSKKLDLSKTLFVSRQGSLLKENVLNLEELTKEKLSLQANLKEDPEVDETELTTHLDFLEFITSKIQNAVCDGLTDAKPHITRYVFTERKFFSTARYSEKDLSAIESKVIQSLFTKEEKEKYLSSVYGAVKGSCDLFIINVNHKTKEVFLQVLDLKTGRIAVEAKNNYQLLYYTLCILEETRALIDSFIEKGYTLRISHTIVQNFSKSNPEGIEIKLESLKTFLILLSTFFQALERGQLLFRTGKHCTYCPYSFFCPSVNHVVDTYVDIYQEDIEILELLKKHLKEDDVFSEEKILHAYKHVDTLQLFVDTIKKSANLIFEARQRSGQDLPTFVKVKQTKTHRAWKEDIKPEEIAQLLQEEAGVEVKLDEVLTIPKLKSPAQIEGVIKEKGLSNKEVKTIVNEDLAGLLAPTHTVVSFSLDKKKDKVVFSAEDSPIEYFKQRNKLAGSSSFSNNTSEEVLPDLVLKALS